VKNCLDRNSNDDSLYPRVRNANYLYMGVLCPESHDDERESAIYQAIKIQGRTSVDRKKSRGIFRGYQFSCSYSTGN
jgi:hypothetical protein